MIKTDNHGYSRIFENGNKMFHYDLCDTGSTWPRKKHNSMLIHVTRFQVWQNHIKDIIDQQFRYYKSEIEANDPGIMEEFREILEVDTPNYKSFSTVSKEILESKSFSKIDTQIKIHTWEEIRPFCILLFKK